MTQDGVSDAIALFHMGAQALQEGQWETAAQVFRQALAIDAQFAEAHANLAYVLDRLDDHSSAEQHWRHALTLAPDNATLHLNLGALLAQQQRHNEAEACYAAALALEPRSSAVWSNLGVLNLNLQREETAEACLRHAMALDPENGKACFNLAYLQLRRGLYEEGWALFEKRDWYRAMAQRLDFARWSGQSLANKRLLLCFEAGHGDVIQFCRYARELKALGARHITLLCHPALTRLMAGLQGLDAVCSFDDELPAQAFDYWTPLMSVPYLLDTRLESVPAALPYLQAEDGLQTHWARQMGPTTGVRVGLVWKGNPDFENDAARSLPHLQTLSPLWQVPGIQFVSLQKGAGEEQSAQCMAQQPLLELGSRMQSFADAAAILQNLDLLITVDTAMAHLAGAMGKPCWLLLPWYMADWRWGAQGSATAWYPQVMRLFRQGPEADWAPVVQAVTLALMEPTMPQATPRA
jgi:Tfp pilus assembly protein PilF